VVYCTRSAAPLCRVPASVHVLHVEVLYMRCTGWTFGSQRTPNRDGSIDVFFLDQHVNDWLSSDGSDHAVSNPTVCNTPCQRLDYPQHVVDIKMTSKSLLMLIIGGPKVNPSPS